MNINTHTVEAIVKLAPNANFRTKDGQIFWDSPDIVQPSEANIITKANELEAEYDAQEYARNRATEYPAITDQLDEIYHNGIDSWKAVIKVTKDKYPKG